MRFTVLRLSPDAAASDRVDQCVAFLGVDSSIIVSTRSTSASLTLRGVLGVAALPAQQNHPRSQGQRLRRFGAPGPTLQRLALRIGQAQWWNGAAGTHLSYSLVQETCDRHYLLREL
jgi:hypothetical protein